MDKYKTSGFYLFGITVCVFLILGSCSDESKPLFEKSSEQRLSEAASSLSKTLLAEKNGWIVQYKTTREYTGYFTFAFKFIDETQVDIASDFSTADFDFKRSEYRIIQGSTLKLSFSTFSALHKLSDSGFSPIPNQGGAGLKGDFEFLYYGTDSEGNLIFKTNREQLTVILKKATTSNGLADIRDSHINAYEVFLLNNPTPFKSFIYSNGGNEIVSNFKINSDTRVISLSRIISKDGIKGFEEEYNVGYAIVPNQGLRLDSIRTVGDKVEKSVLFTLKTNKRYESTLSDGSFVSFGPTDKPIINNRDHRIFLDVTKTSSLQYTSADRDIPYELTSDSFRDMYIRASGIGISSTSIFNQLLVGARRFDYFAHGGTASVTNSTVRNLVRFVDKGDVLVFESTGWREPTSGVKPANLAAYNQFMSFFTDPEGLYFENLGRKTRYSNDIFRLTSVKNPSLFASFYHFKP
ncbi:MAG: DUF4302 domain-containing protein [Cyclobacteriaceae bacterium]|nr:DUF4302 domain-containing protein [Cyclobacteriaceae bacterium]